MIQIDDKQIDRIGDAMLTDKIIVILCQSFPEAAAALDNKEGRQTVRAQIEKARSYGIEFELDLGRYVITAWLLGLDFDTKYPTMNAVLVSSNATATRKMEAIEQITEAIFATLDEGKK